MWVEADAALNQGESNLLLARGDVCRHKEGGLDDMFEQAILAPAPLGKRVWSTCAGVSGQVLLVGALILAPLVFPQVLPQVQSLVTLVAPGPPPPPPGGGTIVRPRPAQATRQFRCTFCAPPRVPEKIEMVAEDPPETRDVGVIGGMSNGSKDGVKDGVLTSLMSQTAFAPPPPPRPVTQTPVQVRPSGPISVDAIAGGRVRLAHPIHRVEPPYPPLARQAHVQGTVELEGIIAVDGHLRDLRIRSGHPLLVKAAYDAVKQWIYAPTTLNEQPVEVIAPITVTFRLN
jgi:periplasmic protein TonB